MAVLRDGRNEVIRHFMCVQCQAHDDPIARERWQILCALPNLPLAPLTVNV